VLSIEGDQPGVVDMSGNKWLRLSDSPYYIMSFHAGDSANLLRLSEEIDLERSQLRARNHALAPEDVIPSLPLKSRDDKEEVVEERV